MTIRDTIYSETALKSTYYYKIYRIKVTEYIPVRRIIEADPVRNLPNPNESLLLYCFLLQV